MPITFVSASADTSFVAYLHYLEDIANVIRGRYGDGVGGVYDSLRLHPPVRQLPSRRLAPADMRRLATHLNTTWTTLTALDNAAAGESFHRQANAVTPLLAVEAVTAVAAALAVALPAEEPDDARDALSLLGDLASDELLPYPWSAFCVGCPQLGSTAWGGSVLPGRPVSVFQPPAADTSDARLAILLRTTRQRALDGIFAAERRTDVKPGRSRRNLTHDDKAAIAATVAPTTIFDVLDRVRARVATDDGEAFVHAPYDDAEALRFAQALHVVVDTSVAAIEAVIAALVGWDVVAELVASHRRRGASTAAARRAAALRAV